MITFKVTEQVRKSVRKLNCDQLLDMHYLILNGDYSKEVKKVISAYIQKRAIFLQKKTEKKKDYNNPNMTDYQYVQKWEKNNGR